MERKRVNVGKIFLSALLISSLLSFPSFAQIEEGEEKSESQQILPSPQSAEAEQRKEKEETEQKLLSEETVEEKEQPEKITNISVDFKDTDLSDVLKVISKASGLNVVIDKDVSARVNVSLKDVDWKTALDVILKTNNLTYKIQGNILRVMSLDKLKEEEEEIPLVTDIITPNFAHVEDLYASLNKMLSPRGSMQVYVRTNSLIITDIPEAIERIRKLIEKLDNPTSQVLIEALIMSVKLSETDKFGIDWTATHKDVSARKISQSLRAPSSTLDLYYGKTILPHWAFEAQLALYAQDKRVKILANPRVLTLDNLTAHIEITEQVPYTYTSSSAEGTVTSTQFKDIGIKLYVTPHITKDKFISLNIKAEQSYVAAYIGDTNEPSIDSRKAETNLLLKDRETVVIGGLRKKDDTVTVEKVPLLGDVPFLGALFRRKVKETTESELLIFITPYIVERASVSEVEKRKLRDSKEELTKRDKELLSQPLKEKPAGLQWKEEGEKPLKPLR